MSDDRDIDLVEQEDVMDASPGARLRQARELKKLSLDDVAKHLYLGVEKIEALERGEVEKIAMPVFAAGYLRAYARLLDLPGDEIVSAFGEALVSKDASSVDLISSPAANNYGKVQYGPPDSALLNGNNRWQLITLVALLGVVLPTISFFVWNNNDVASVEETAKVSVEAAVVMAKPILEPAFNPTPNKEWESNDVMIDEQTESVAIVIEALDVEVDDVEPGKAEAQSGDETLAPTMLVPTVDDAQPQSELALYFSEDSWVEVHDARGQRLVYRLGQAGMASTVMGVAPFDVQLGYVLGVNIIYNGESYDLSRFEGRRQVRFRVGKLGDHINNG